MDSDKLGNSFRSFSVKNYMKERVYFSCGFAAGKEKKKLFANSTNDKATGHAAQLKKKKSQLKNGQT